MSATNVDELIDIVRDLACAVHSDWVCSLCGECAHDGDISHEPECPYRRAVEWLKRNEAPK